MKKYLLFIVFFIIQSSLFSQNITIKGKLIDENTKEPVMFATIQLKGTNYGVMSDDNGLFSLTISNANNILVIRNVGYKELVLNASTFKNDKKIIKLSPLVRELNPVTIYTPEAILKMATEKIRDNNYPSKFYMDLEYTQLTKIQDTIYSMALSNGVYKHRGYKKANNYFDYLKCKKITSDKADSNFILPLYDLNSNSYVDRFNNRRLKLDLETISDENSNELWYIIIGRHKNPKQTGGNIPCIFKAYIRSSDFAFVKVENILDTAITVDSVKTGGWDWKYISIYNVQNFEKIGDKYVLINAFTKHKYIMDGTRLNEQEKKYITDKGMDFNNQLVEVKSMMNVKEIIYDKDKLNIEEPEGDISFKSLDELKSRNEFSGLLLDDDSYEIK